MSQKEALQLLAEAQEELCEVIKLQQKMMNDLKNYVVKRDEIMIDMLKNIEKIWEK